MNIKKILIGIIVVFLNYVVYNGLIKIYQIEEVHVNINKRKSELVINNLFIKILPQTDNPFELNNFKADTVILLDYKNGYVKYKKISKNYDWLTTTDVVFLQRYKRLN